MQETETKVMPEMPSVSDDGSKKAQDKIAATPVLQITAEIKGMMNNENLEKVAQLDFQLAEMEKRKEELLLANAELAEMVAADTSDLCEYEKAVSDLQAKLQSASQKTKASRSNYDEAQEKMRERTTKIKAMKRALKEADMAFTVVSQRQQEPTEDRMDFQRLQQLMGVLENDLRKQIKIKKSLKVELKFTRQQMNVPIQYTKEEEMVLRALNDPEAETIEDDILTMEDELKSHERDLRELDAEIKVHHKQNCEVSRRYERLRKLSKEKNPVTDTQTTESITELFERLSRTTKEIANYEQINSQMLTERLIENGTLEATIQRRLSELERAKVSFASECADLRKEISSTRNQLDDESVALVDKLKRLAQRSHRQRRV